jgi:hypothetical protein
MLGLASLFGIVAYTLVYAGVTGKNWTSPFVVVEQAFGRNTQAPSSPPDSAGQIAGELLGIFAVVEAAKIAAGAAGGIFKSILPIGGGGGGGGGGEGETPPLEGEFGGDVPLDFG